jgi:ferredoxin-type protein NapF
MQDCSQQMARPISRMQFLRGDFKNARPVRRPPWAWEETLFIRHCTRCGECVRHCPEGVLVTGWGGYPQVDFARGGCTFCAECVAACAPHALAHRTDHDMRVPWELKARPGEGCLARRRIVCRTCGEHCEAGAIRFRIVDASIARPEVVQDLCTGCGACYAVCPVRAIDIR